MAASSQCVGPHIDFLRVLALVEQEANMVPFALEDAGQVLCRLSADSSIVK
eukprot:CAMPEP_0203921964 /NCGR_PEP_ID=MMETSP0359-20131031/62062_1 /ASSEMBLY_ACC=CAM_ASM_000338 /TAXON_ID=268821 /ORGANISM="Scrippsiella Hangoei, Strain SHTV-5" /LENGTH=50 /DNA_ID=CAMNT_0050849745 /DNA_START=44 /DNA_END=193 /DNA_ORIENTATION=+